MLKDREILRDLAKKYAEIAALPVMEEKKNLWRKLNGLKPERPMVIVDQVCWNEMDVDGELTCLCGGEEARRYEQDLRRTLYSWKHMPADMAAEPFIRVERAIGGLDFDVRVEEDTLETDPSNDVLSRHYHNQFEGWDDLEKIKMPAVTHDTKETARRMAFAHEMFDGVIDVRENSMGGWGAYLSVWDLIPMWMGGVENTLLMLVDEPEFMHAVVNRMVEGYMSMLDQLEEQGLLNGPQSYIHCTGAWTDELPPPGYDPAKPRTRDIWMFGLAQMFSSISPAMFDEFEIEPCMPIFDRFGLVYYGCCDPLDGKMKEVRKIKKARKLSVSPWANQEKMAREIDGKYVFSRKPNPALLAWDSFDEDLIRKDLTATRDICREYNCPLELIQKDISTVRNDPRRLWRWAEIAGEIAMS